MQYESLQINADHEYRAHADQHASLRLWLRLLSCTTRVEDKIRQNCASPLTSPCHALT